MNEHAGNDRENLDDWLRAKPRMRGELEDRLRAESAEITRLRGMILYAIDGPDNPECWRKILTDALNGISGADSQTYNAGAHRPTREAGRSECSALLGEKPEE